MPDAVVIGAGPNGLSAANHLADHGWSVTVLEANEEPGGAVRSGEITRPGFISDLFSAFYPLAVSSPALVELELEKWGLTWRQSPLVLAHPLPDGRCATLSTDLGRTAANMDTFAPGDGDRWRKMIADWERISGPLLDAFLGPFPPVRAATTLAARLGPSGLLHFARHALLPVRRMGEELFAGEGGRLLLGGSAGHADLSPEAAASGLYGWLLSCLGQTHGFPVPQGGAGQLTAAMVRRLEARGGRVVCGARVERVVIRSGRAVAVRTEAGDEIDADRAVLADVAAPHLFLNLVGPDHLPSRLMDDLARFQWDMSTVKVDWALSRPVPWSAPEAGDAGTVHIADDFDNFTEFAAHLAMGLLPARPFLLFGQQSKADPGRSPEGTETAWAYTHVPRIIRGDAAGQIHVHGRSDQDAWIGQMVERIEDRIEGFAPGFKDSIIGRHCFGPHNLEGADSNLDLGAINGGTSQLHQQLVFRPVPNTGRPSTPIGNLFLASSSAHPGGGVHGSCGANAAHAALAADRQLSRVVKKWRNQRAAPKTRG
jgi:phytoene dehydrogenase-like protein